MTALPKAAPGRLCCFLLLCCLVWPLWVLAGQDATVRHVTDGDTVVLDSGQTLRLWGVDTPEMGHGGAPDQFYAREARQGLENLLARDKLTLVLAPESEDQYHRLLGTLRLPDGALVNVELVRQGLAFYYPHPRSGDWLAGELLQAQRQAMREGRGFWSEMLLHLRSVGPVVGNRRSLRFFTQDCRDAGNIASGNREVFQEAAEAFWQGYAPARHCGVWPDAR